MTLLAFLVLLGVLITAHEFGHFVLAKLFGVKVITFSIGFGKPLFSIHRGETEYRIAALPLGGYVRMLGLDPDDPREPDDAGRSLLDKPPWIRILIAFAGPAMNFVLPFLLLLPMIGFASRYHEVRDNTVGAVDQGLPAWKAGLREGDAIVAIDGEPVYAFWQVAEHIQRFDDDTGHLAITVKRPGEEKPVSFEVTPEAIEETLFGVTRRIYRIGFAPYYLTPDVAVTNPQSALAAAGVRTFDRISKVAGKPVERFIDLERALRALPAGEQVKLEVLRPKVVEGVPGFLAATASVALNYAAPSEASTIGLDHAGACITSVRSEGPGKALQRGDCVLGVDGERHNLGAFLHNRLSNRPSEAKKLLVRRAGAELELEIKPEKVVHTDPFAGEIELWRLGFVMLDISPGGSPRARGILPIGKTQNSDRFGHAWFATREQVMGSVTQIVQTVGGMFTGQVSARQLSGPVSIFVVAGEQARAGFEQFLRLMVVLSLNLALLNLLPIPVLDGGHIMMALGEMIMRRPVPDKVQRGLQAFGVLLVVGLMLFAFGNDMIRVFRMWGG